MIDSPDFCRWVPALLPCASRLPLAASLAVLFLTSSLLSLTTTGFSTLGSGGRALSGLNFSAPLMVSTSFSILSFITLSFDSLSDCSFSFCFSLMARSAAASSFILSFVLSVLFLSLFRSCERR